MTDYTMTANGPMVTLETTVGTVRAVFLGNDAVHVSAGDQDGSAIVYRGKRYRGLFDFNGPDWAPHPSRRLAPKQDNGTEMSEAGRKAVTAALTTALQAFTAANPGILQAARVHKLTEAWERAKADRDRLHGDYLTAFKHADNLRAALDAARGES